MHARRALSALVAAAASSVVALASVVVGVSPAAAENGPPPPACPFGDGWGSWVVFDWPGNLTDPASAVPSEVYVTIPGLPLGCFASFCPAGTSKVSPYADGRDPETVQGPYREWSWIDGPPALVGAGAGQTYTAALNGFVPPGCTQADGSKLPAPSSNPGSTGSGTGGVGGQGAVTGFSQGLVQVETSVLSDGLIRTPAATADGEVSRTSTLNVFAVEADTQVLADGAAPAVGGQRLPRTGGEPTDAVIVAVLLVGAGAALVGGSLRRRGGPSPEAPGSV